MRKITNSMIHPELRKTGIVFRIILPYFKLSTFRKCNCLLRFLKGKCGRDMRYDQAFIPRVYPDPESLRLCIYRPKRAREKGPGILWMHGGGYGLGVPEQDEGFIRDFVNRFGCTVISPDYRLSVDQPYPAALEDCYAALLWMKEHADKLNIRDDQLMVGGDSAGGGLAAALAIYARDREEAAIAFQMPLYPMIDDRMITGSSRDNDAPVWNTKSNVTGWKSYLGELYGTDDVPAYAAAARLEDYSSLPSAFTYVGSVEPFRDETIDYMEKLKAAGVPVDYRVFDGCYHGFDIVAPKSEPAREARKLLGSAFAYAKENYFAEQPESRLDLKHDLPDLDSPAMSKLYEQIVKK